MRWAAGDPAEAWTLQQMLAASTPKHSVLDALRIETSYFLRSLAQSLAMMPPGAGGRADGPVTDEAGAGFCADLGEDSVIG